MTGTVRLLLADDNPIVRFGLAQILAGEPDVEVVGEAENGASALELTERLRPDVVLLDVRMPVLGGLDVLDDLVALAGVLMLSQVEEPATVVDTVRRGAKGYLVYGAFGAEALVHAVRTVARGGTVYSPGLVAALSGASAAPHPVSEPASDQPAWALTLLSARECEVMVLVSRGVSNQDIAARLFLSYKTVKNHLNRIFSKLGVATRSEAIALWVGTVPPRTGL